MSDVTLSQSAQASDLPSDWQSSWHDTPWVQIMCDFSADSVWNVQGESTCADSLPVSRRLAAQLTAWNTFYDQHAPAYDEFSPAWDASAVSAYGRCLALAVKMELPDWTVIYFDSNATSNSTVGSDRRPLEYEITL